jgi:hypothetical protein
MLVIEPVRYRDETPVKPVVSGLVASDQQDRSPTRIEGVKHAQRVPARLNAKLPHMPMSRAFDPRRVRERQPWALLFQKADRRANIDLLTVIQSGKPLAELIGVLDHPGHTHMYAPYGIKANQKI